MVDTPLIQRCRLPPSRNPLSRFEDERAAKEKAYKALEEKLKSEYEKNKAEKEAKLEAEVQKVRWAPGPP